VIKKLIKEKIKLNLFEVNFGIEYIVCNMKIYNQIIYVMSRSRIILK